MHALPAATVGLGLRRSLMDALIDAPAGAFDFLEFAPDNWIGVDGPLRRQFDALAARHPLSAHGLSLSLGGTDPLDRDLLARTRELLERHSVRLYSEHLSYCAADGQLYDLLPIPFTREAVRNSIDRIRETQDTLGRRIAIENVSYYAAPFQAMPESEFILSVLDGADCDLLLDVNNIYVNSVNHGYDARDFLAAMPGERIASCHVAGHHDEAPDLKIDTHGADVCEAVWDLLAEAYRLHGVRPTVLERDFDIPPLAQLLAETNRIRALQQAAIASPEARQHA